MTRSPFHRHSKAYFRYPLNFERMQGAMVKLVGQHDFTGFTASGSSVDDKVRTIYQAEIIQLDKENFKFIFREMVFCINKSEIWLEPSLKSAMTECLSVKLIRF